MTQTMPAIFFGHGSPMNALDQNEWTRAWTRIGREMPRPKAVLCISAHWYVPEIAVAATENPRTIHDFAGFPPELFEVRYPAPGSPELAGRVELLLKPAEVRGDTDRGLDHGVWSVFRHVFPAADVPIVQLSIDRRQPAAFHYELAAKLEPLRDEGILICGNGNIVHNLRAYLWDEPKAEPHHWALRFEQRVREMILRRDHGWLVDYESSGSDALLSAPTPEHFLPLLYVLALQRENEKVSFPVEGFDGGSISMLSVQFG